MTAAHSASGQGPKLKSVDNAQISSPGQRLARARVQRNLSLEDVAKQLNLSASMVRALESDNHKALPGRAFVKGYLRNYAKLVGLAPDELVKVFESQFTDTDEVAFTPNTKHPARWIAPIIRGVGYLVIVAVLVSMVGAVFQNFGYLWSKAQQLSASFSADENAASVPTEPAATDESTDEDVGDAVKLAIPLHPVESSPVTADTPSVPPETNQPPAEGVVVPPQSSLVPERAITAQVADGALPAASAGAGTADVVTQRADKVDAEKVDAENEVRTETGAASVSLNFLAASWVRVKDANDKLLFDGVKQAGAELQLQGKAPLRVRLGNAPGVKIAFNGKPYDFDVSSHSNVAQFTLGDE